MHRWCRRYLLAGSGPSLMECELAAAMGVAVEPCAPVLPGPGWHAPGGAVVPVGRLVVAGGASV